MYFQRIQSYLEIERSNWINQHITWANRPITLLSPFFADYKLALLAHHFTSKIYNLLTINFPEYRSSKPCVRSLNKIIALEHILQYQYLRSIRSNYQYGLTRLSAFRSDLEIKLVYIKESDKTAQRILNAFDQFEMLLSTCDNCVYEKSHFEYEKLIQILKSLPMTDLAIEVGLVVPEEEIVPLNNPDQTGLTVEQAWRNMQLQFVNDPSPSKIQSAYWSIMTIFTDDEVIFNEVQNTSEIDLVKVFGRKDENDEESDENENAHKDGQADEEDAKTLMITFPSMLQLDEVKSTRKRKRKWKEEAYLDESSESEEVVLERKSAKILHRECGNSDYLSETSQVPCRKCGYKHQESICLLKY